MKADRVLLMCGRSTVKFTELRMYFAELVEMARAEEDTELTAFVAEVANSRAAALVNLVTIFLKDVTGKRDLLLDEVMELCKAQECSEHKDKIFAILSLEWRRRKKHLERTIIPFGITADYSKSE